MACSQTPPVILFDAQLHGKWMKFCSSVEWLHLRYLVPPGLGDFIIVSVLFLQQLFSQSVNLSRLSKKAALEHVLDITISVLYKQV